MAFIRATGKHRRPTPARCTSRRAAAGVAGLAAAGVVGSLTSPALAADNPQSAGTSGLAQAVNVGDSLADQISDQAAAQQAAAEKAKAEAEAKKRVQEAKRKAAAERAAKERAEKRAEERAARAAAEKRAKLFGFVAPVADAVVSTGYQASSGLWSSGSHSGIDFQASSGTSVRSVAAGEVVEAAFDGSYGNNVVIKHNDGTYTQYGHLSSLTVSVGQSVTSGEQIGLSGSTGNTTGPHLHFEARTGAEYGSDIDPLSYLRKHGVSL